MQTFREKVFINLKNIMSQRFPKLKLNFNVEDWEHYGDILSYLTTTGMKHAVATHIVHEATVAAYDTDQVEDLSEDRYHPRDQHYCYDEGSSGIYKFCCGCIGVRLSEPNEIYNGDFEVDALVLSACDGEGYGLEVGVRRIAWERPKSNERSVPLTRQEFHDLQYRIISQMNNGNKYEMIQKLLLPK